MKDQDTFISNIYDPSRSDFETKAIKGTPGSEIHTLNLNTTKAWLEDKRLGPPRGTATKSEAELVELGYVGVYYQPIAVIALDKASLPTIDQHPPEPIDIVE